MKQKVVIKFQNVNKKCLSKAMKIAVGVPGLESVGFQGDNKDQLVVIGNDIDTVCLTSLLRKKVGFGELISVTPMGEELMSQPQVQIQSVVWPYDNQVGVPQHFFCVQECDNNRDPCTIL